MTSDSQIAFEERFALVSERVMRDGYTLNVFYRERPMSREDSGWRFFAGDEEGEFIANPDNTACYTIGEVLARAPEILPYLEREIGAAFDRSAGNGFEDVSGKQLYE